MSESFPRLHARTRRFTLGVPRGFTIAPDGSHIVFLRTKGGSDPVTCLWEFDVASGQERLIADPRVIAAGEDGEDLPPEERARRERSREQAGGIVGYSTDTAVTTAAFTLSGNLYVIDLKTRSARRLQTPGQVIDPRVSPDGVYVGYVSGGAFHIHDLEDEVDHVLARPESPEVTYGLAEFIAAEELNRMRGYWWSPSGDAVLVARVDESPVAKWHIADPANPSRSASEQRYPAAGTANAKVELFVLTVDGSRTPVPFDDEYLVTASWDTHGLTIVTMPRDQKTMRLLDVDPATGTSTVVREDTDPAWIDVVPGVPGRLSDGTLVWAASSEGGHRLIIGDRPVTPATLQVREILDIDGDAVLFRASGEPTEIALWAYKDGRITLVSPAESGVYSGHTAGGTLIVTGQTLGSEGSVTRVSHHGTARGHIASHAERPGLDLRVSLVRAGKRDLSTAVLFPSGHVPGSAKLPVLMDPYGGPHAQRVLAASGAYLTSQWFADQGFAVVVADGRGTPGRGPEFERAVLHDLATPPLEDQIDALHGAAAQFPDDLDLSRVGIRGWSFGGFLAALAVLRRPDVFHAAIAGAPVTDWRLYDTCYTERYLGHPDAGHYDSSSLFADAEKLDRPLLLIHGLADDNVVAAHTLRLSSALLAAGRPHNVLPLSGVTHMTPQEVVAENLLLLQVDFLKKALS
ncbi:prolyl oligopeptidase family serine peptidase [Streptosporangium sp. NPDC000396]|uniref:S9 family peptidase n=1 Tax=Streptosporangium sp. NPDC000396 TaxID=3366185 RepID=UPI0036BF72E8